MTDDDLSYYRRREQEERLAAGRAASPAAESAHRKLADQYSAVIETRGRLASA